MKKTSALFTLPALLVVGVLAQPVQQRLPNVDLGLTGKFVFRVSDVQAGSPAEAAGIKPGDILMRIGNRRIQSPEDLALFGQSHKPGEIVDLAYERPALAQSGRPTILRQNVELQAPRR